MTKKGDKIKVSFVGMNCEEVTGSMTLIEFDKTKILLEAGLYQSNNIKKDYEINSRKFKFKVKEIDYIFVNHVHIDHCGLLPKLYAEGCKAKIIVINDSNKIMRKLLKDSAFIMQKDVETLNRTNKTNGIYKPIYTNDDVEKVFDNIIEYDFKTLYELDENISFEFIPSGHIIRAGQLKLWINRKNKIKTILYTSDLGNIQIKDKPFVDKFEMVEKADLVIGEATYSNPKRESKLRDRIKDIEKIKSVVLETCIDRNSRVLIPTFSLDRTQFLLKILYDLFGEDEKFNIPIIVDSPLSCKITKIYREILEGEDKILIEKIMNWKNVRFIENSDESKIFVSDNTPAIILSASGMMTAGRSRFYVKNLLPNSNATVLFCGYASEGSLAWKIKNGTEQKTINIDGKPYRNKINIVDLLSFSSHMQREDLLNYYSEIQCEKIALVHSNFKDKCEFGKALQNIIANKNKTSKVIIVNKSTSINL